MSTPDTEWGIALDLGQHWYPLPLDREPTDFGAEVTEVLIEEAPTMVGRPLSREVAEAIAEEFTIMTANAQTTRAFAASLYRPLFDGPTVAMLQSHVTEGDPGADLIGWVKDQHPDPAMRREYQEVALPIGPAIRMREVAGAPEQGQETVVVESVTHFFQAPGSDVIRLALSWTSPAFSDDLQVMADSIAGDVAFQ